MKRQLDYRTCTENDIDAALNEFTEDAVDFVEIVNIHPSVFENRYDMEIDDENGFDMDWWGHMEYNDKQINIRGCCRYGYIIIENCEDE